MTTKYNLSRERTRTTTEEEESQPPKQSTLAVKLNPKARFARPFVESTLRKGVLGLIKEFRSMKRDNDYTKMKEFVAQNANGRNRYKDVGCLDNSRVTLNIGQVPYIHANYVATPNNKRRFICTQGPLPSTCAEFWCMVVQERTHAILMLCNFLEMGCKKCAEYFPRTAGASVNFNNGEVVVTSKSCQPHKFNIPTKTKLMVSQLEVTVNGYPSHNCTHYHWLDWPDRGVPEADLSPFTLLGLVRDVPQPVVVHCSAGIGRTGAIVLLQHVMDLLHNNVNLGDMKDYLLQLRAQRNNSVQLSGVVALTTVDKCTQGIFINNSTHRAIGVHPSCRILREDMQPMPSADSQSIHVAGHRLNPNYNCSDVILRLVRVNGFYHKRMIMLGMVRRGDRILFYSPAKNRVMPDQLEFHHYTNHVPIAWVMHDFFQIDGFLFVSVIVHKTHIRIVPVDLTIQSRTLTATIPEEGFILPQPICPPKKHKIETVNYNGSEYLAIRYDLFNDNQKAVLLKLVKVFTDHMNIVPVYPTQSLKYSGYFNYTRELYTKCRQEYGDFIAVPKSFTENVDIDLRRITSNNMPSKREGYPFTVTVMEDLGYTKNYSAFTKKTASFSPTTRMV